MSESSDKLEALFDAVAELPRAERQIYLAQACGDDEELRRQVERLLRNLDRAGNFLTQGERTDDRALNALSERPGDRIGRYKLLQQIGEGGCGVVYMAEQEEPVRRRVALKIIKLGMDTKSVIARFEAERQALAMMDHPNIAKVHDAGATDTGRPYFVMELVRGVKITDFCDEKALSTQQRLELFSQVCHAIQHAHQKGIIHRDIKPSNVLVTVNDGVAVPKVIDFGIAKATTDQRLTDKTVFTAFEQFIGTPAYMSPEQAEVTSVDVDTRSDIYSLGVLLYELLTGKTPFDAAELLKVGLDEMRRTIREKEPARPSTRVSTLGGEEITSTAKRRGIDAPKLAGVLRGDLDWIVMKCLEKDRGRRYETANGLAMDIKRHLSSEPVVACPPSKLYRFRKTVRRNQQLFAAAAIILVLLIAGIGVSTWEAVQARRAGKLAEMKAVQAREISKFLTEMLKGAGPEVARGRDATILLEILQKAEGRLSKDLSNQPPVEAELGRTIGRIYLDLGKYQRAETTLRRSIAIEQALYPEGSSSLAWTLIRLGEVLYKQGSFTQAQALFRQAVPMMRKFSGDESAVASALLGLAMALNGEGKPAEAKVAASEALDLYRKPPVNEAAEVGQSQSLMELAIADQAQDNLADAVVKFRQALAIIEKAIGHDNPFADACLNNLASALEDQNQWAEAEKVMRESLALKGKVLGSDHPDVAITLGNLAYILWHLGRLDEAEKAARESVDVGRKSLAKDNPVIAFSRDCLASVLDAKGRPAEAEPLFRETLSLREKLPDRMVAYALNNLAGVLSKQNKLAEAEPLAREGLAIAKNTPPFKKHVADCTCNLADILIRQNKLDEAEKLFSEPLDLASQVNAAMLLQRRGDFFARRTRWKEAATDLGRAVELKPDEHQMWHSLGAVLVQIGSVEAYRAHCRKSLERFGNTTDCSTAHRIAKDCLVVPTSGVDLQTVVRMVETSLVGGTNQTGWPFFACTKALAEYRLGHFLEAADWSHAVLSRSKAQFKFRPETDAWLDAQTYAVLALAQWRLHQSGLAPASLAKGLEAFNALPKLESSDLGGNWLDWVFDQALLREGKELIEGQTPSALAQGQESEAEGPMSKVRGPEASGLGAEDRRHGAQAQLQTQSDLSNGAETTATTNHPKSP